MQNSSRKSAIPSQGGAKSDATRVSLAEIAAKLQQFLSPEECHLLAQKLTQTEKRHD